MLDKLTQFNFENAASLWEVLRLLVFLGCSMGAAFAAIQVFLALIPFCGKPEDIPRNFGIFTSAITTADIDRVSVCNTELAYAKEVRDGTTYDPEYLPVIYEASQDDDWESPETWAKCNPSYPITPNKKYLESKIF